MAHSSSHPLSGPGPDADLIAGLWQEAPFPRLPWDAPAELRDLVEDVDNPRRVYAIHRAGRRHNLQLLVQKYIVQLREGCGVSTCRNATCFTCRRRIAGRAPLRRYNTTSARTLAVHLASLDNPEAGLCAALRLPKTPPAALSSLLFVPTKQSPREDGKAPNGYARSTGSGSFKPERHDRGERGDRSGSLPTHFQAEVQTPAQTQTPPFTILDKPVSKDYRSFAANMFGTVAFKMLEWLTPAAMADLAKQAEQLQERPASGKKRSNSKERSVSGNQEREKEKEKEKEIEGEKEGNGQGKEKEDDTNESSRPEPAADESPDQESLDSTKSSRREPDHVQNGPTGQSGSPQNANTHANANSTPPPSRRNSGRVRPQSTTKPARTISVDPFSADSPVAEDLLPGLRSPRMAGMAGIPGADGLSHRGASTAAKALKTPTATATATATIPRPISQLTNGGYLDDLLEKMPPPKIAQVRPKSGNPQEEPTGESPCPSSDASLRQQDASLSSRSASSDRAQSLASLVREAEADDDGLDAASLDALLPQTLSRLDADVIDLLCDVLQDDHTAEKHMLEPLSVTRFHYRIDGQRGALKRKQRPQPKQQQQQKEQQQQQKEQQQQQKEEQQQQQKGQQQQKEQQQKQQQKQQKQQQRQQRQQKQRQRHRQEQDAALLAQEWRLFAFQSFFYVLSDPQALLQSFTKQGRLFDTQTLWYCMLRMTRVAPSLVLHSLWTAAEALFAPPKALQLLRSARSPRSATSTSTSSRLFPPAQNSLNNAEAGMLMAICLHALVATAPLVDDTRQLYEMSRIRSHGLTLAGSGAVARQPPELCLQYEDAFSNELALRLARRLFSAITARRCFDEMAAQGSVDADAGSPRAGGEAKEGDVLAPLFAQLDFLNNDAAYILNCTVPDRILNFTPPDRMLHETRVQTLLLDWARTVMMHEWDGKPVVPTTGPFGGALALLASIYDRRKDLRVTDVQFRSEYFADRLNEVSMPVEWLSFTPNKQRSHLLEFPYLFSPNALVTYFRAINFWRMSRAYEDSSSLQGRMHAIMQQGSLIMNPQHKLVLQELLSTATAKYLVLDVGRATALQDALDQLWRREERELLRPLKVHLGEDSGEEGFDSGGVQQEFFRLALAEALDPVYGTFVVDERTHMTWFNPATLEAEYKFELVGLLVSLAVYNGISLPVTFPMALYRKLLGEPVHELHHIADGWPELASGLTTLLEWKEQDGAVEDVFVRTYEFSTDRFGQPLTWAMGGNRDGDNPGDTLGVNPGDTLGDTPGDPPMVTAANRDAYVADYIHHLTDVSVRPQFEAFARGFRRCLHPRALTLLTPRLLQSLVEGQQAIDMAELRRQARYVGWDANHRSVHDFWAIVSGYDERQKRKLLEFVTASDRVPVGGVKNIHFVVQRNGEQDGESGHLPTAYTCYGTLLLPEYKSREVMRERLEVALENAQGFGFA